MYVIDTGDGIDRLQNEIVRAVAGDELSRIARERVVLNSRLVTLLEAARERASALSAAIESHNQLEILALEARELLGLYEDATGRRYQHEYCQQGDDLGERRVPLPSHRLLLRLSALPAV